MGVNAPPGSQQEITSESINSSVVILRPWFFGVGVTGHFGRLVRRYPGHKEPPASEKHSPRSMRGFPMLHFERDARRLRVRRRYGWMSFVSPSLREAFVVGCGKYSYGKSNEVSFV